MGIKKKAAAKAVKPKGVPGTIYYRGDSGLYRVVSKDIDWGDLSDVPAGKTERWDGSMWSPAKMPEALVVHRDERGLETHRTGEVSHTKNTANIGV